VDILAFLLAKKRILIAIDEDGNALKINVIVRFCIIKKALQMQGFF
jgi:hypothetical protein